jgi:hypothetical protein
VAWRTRRDGSWIYYEEYPRYLDGPSEPLYLAASATLTSDPGTEKLIRDLLDRGYKMHVMAGTARVAEHDPDSNDPLIAWLSDVRSVLYGKTRPVPTQGDIGTNDSTDGGNETKG